MAFLMFVLLDWLVHVGKSSCECWWVIAIKSPGLAVLASLPDMTVSNSNMADCSSALSLGLHVQMAHCIRTMTRYTLEGN